jgi:hypothetical protein
MILTPVVDLSGSMFVDGCVILSSPFYSLTNEERKSTLGINFQINTSRDCPVQIGNIFEYFKQLYVSAYYHQYQQLHKEWGHRIIIITPKRSSSLNTEIGVDEKEELIQVGRSEARKFLNRASSKMPRRYSLP